MVNEKKVQILMSTFNGENYIQEQIESILNQVGVNIDLLIRDDGSSDKTELQIKKMQKKYPNRIHFISGKNVGFRKSFLQLVQYSSNQYDYFAFADQDDVWLPEKIIRAIRILENNKCQYKLYGSTVTITDESLQVLYTKKIKNYKLGFGSTITRMRIAGCTMVFNRQLFNLMRKVDFKNTPDDLMTTHDTLLMTLATAVDAYIYIDTRSYILHRRLENSVTSGGNGLIKRVRSEWKGIFSFVGATTYLLKRIKETIPSQITNDNMELINLVIRSQNSIYYRILLCFNKKMDCGFFIGNLENKIKIMTNGF